MGQVYFISLERRYLINIVSIKFHYFDDLLKLINSFLVILRIFSLCRLTFFKLIVGR